MEIFHAYISELDKMKDNVNKFVHKLQVTQLEMPLIH